MSWSCGHHQALRTWSPTTWISLTVEPGEIHCLLGENGAGKSTLMNVLYGLYRADEGEILLDDEVQHFTGPGDAIAAGIGMVHQHFMLVPVFTVAENVMLGDEATGFAGTLDLDAARKRVEEISQRFGFHVNPMPSIEDLPVGVQQRVEIIKALSRDAEVLVFDEPTAVLTPAGDRRADGHHAPAQGGRQGHRLHHPQAPRGARGRRPDHRHPARQGGGRGRAHGQQPGARLDDGRPPGRADGAQGSRPSSATTPWSSTDLRVIDAVGHVHVDDLSFTIKRGEVLAVAGVQGNGQTELTEALLGLRTTSPARSSSTARSWSAGRRARSSTPASASCPRTARWTAWWAT